MKKLRVVTEVEIPEGFGSFQEVESRVRGEVFRAGAELLAQAMRLYEAAVLEKRRYWRKDVRPKRFQTLVGEVLVRRWRVWDWREQRHRYPLDEWLQMTGQERATPSLQKAIVELCVQRPYRQATREIERWTGVKRRAMTNWRLIQQTAQAERAQDPPVPDWYLKPIPSLDSRMRQDPCPILAIDPDATYCHNQAGEGKDHEVKIAVLYTGKEPEGGSRHRWRLVHKQVVISRTGESVQDFFNRITQTAMSRYGAHGRTQIISHGDGDPWIKGLKTNYWDQALLRLDPWHLKKKIRLATGLTFIPPEWEKSIYGDPDALVFQLQGFKLRKTTPRSEAREKIEELIAYVKNNREGLLPSGVSSEIKEKYPRMFLRGSGTIESNVGHAFNARFKQPRMSWSAPGLDNLAYLREKFLNGYPQPRFRVPEPLTRKVA